jgi:hypothetical protein
MKHRNFSWTPEFDNKLRALWATEMPTRKIAETLGNGLTKNSVIGRARVLRIPCKKRKNTAAVEQKHRSVEKIRDRSVTIVPIVRAPIKPVPVEFGVSLLSASPHQCRWPLEGFGSDGMPRCCGEKSVDGTPYCVLHCRAAFTTALPKLTSREAA